jgi:predicted ATPase/signal transduction histidine kinase
LKLDYVTDLIAETLHSDTVSVKPLAELVVRKTKGNPFFVNQFLTTLYQENLLTFIPPPNGGWQWDTAKIEAVDITDNVVELMSGKFKKLPESTQQVSRLAACVGNQFNLNTLSLIYEKSAIETFRDLCPAIQEGLVLPLSELKNSYSNVSSSDLLILNYKFLHDRVQQAAYALINENDKKAVHLRIGRLLLANLSSEERLERIFELVDHLNLARELITGDHEQVELAKLNLAAGQKAKDATAYAAAKDYLTVGMERLSPDSWSQHYELMFTLHKERAELEYLNGNFEQSESLIHLILEKAKSAIEKADIYKTLIVQYTLIAKYSEALQTGKKALALLGIELPKSNLQTALDVELAKAKENLGYRKIDSLIDEPEMTIAEIKSAVKLLDSLLSSTYISHQELFLLLVAKLVNLSLKYGHISESASSYAFYGLIVGYICGDYKSGHDFCHLGLELSKKFNTLVHNCKASAIFGAFVNHWVKPLKTSYYIHQDGYKAGLESGELQFAGYIVMNQLFNQFYQGENLENLLETAPKYLHFGQKTKNYGVADPILVFQSMILNLRGLTPEKLFFDNDSTNEAEYLKGFESRQSFFALCHYQIYKSQVLYLYEKPVEALQCSLEAKKLLAFIPGAFSTTEHNFYYSLSLAALYPEVSEEVQKYYWRQLEANQNQMEIWADNCPENFLHKYLLVEAEIARIFGQHLEAIDLYEYAIESARENEFIQNEALANELAAKFWLSRGKEKIAKVYMSEAHYGYQRWGATRKVEDLEDKYPQLVLRTASSANSIRTPLTSTTSNSTNSGSSVLDLATVMKASQVIYGEIVLDKLLAKLMKILIENAGAQKGYLILEKAGKLLIEAEGGVGRNRITVLQSIPISSEASMSLATSVINYVVRTKETVVLNDASREGKFTNDSYITQHQAKSILCTPLINQGKLISILYLENNLTTGAFTCDRVELLKLLSAQASISIENAQLYNNLQQFNQNLEQLVDERTTELSQTLANLKATQTQLVEAEKMAALGGLVAGVAHEINTPLGIGVTAASLLADKSTALSEAFKNGKMKRSDLEKYLDTATSSTTLILSNLSRAAELIKSFKQVAVDQSCEKRRIFGVKAYLQEILLNLRPKLKRTKLTIEIHGDENLTIDSYPGAFSQIVTNLVMNSLTHAYEPEDEGRIVLEFQQNSEQFIFQYRDDGKGIPGENLSKIFEPFFTTKRGQGGSGLGLHIIYNLVTQRLKGTIQCKSQVGSGTSFLLEFPIQADSDK